MPRTASFGLGLAPRKRTSFINALNTGQGGSWLQSHPGVGRRVSRLNPEQQGRIYSWGVTSTDPWAAQTQNTTPEDVTTPPTNTPPPPTDPDAWKKMVEKYLGVDVPGGSGTIFPTYTPDYTSPQEYDVLGNYLTRNLANLGGAGTLGSEYQRQADLAAEIANREIEKGAAGLREAYVLQGMTGKDFTALVVGNSRYVARTGLNITKPVATLKEIKEALVKHANKR